MDNLSDRGKEMLNRADSRHLDRVGKPTKPAAYLEGTRDGKPVVRLSDGSIVPQRTPITNGAIAKGQRVIQRGDRIDAMPAPKIVRQEEAVVASKNRLKYLYSLYSDGGWRFYVGGWQKDSVLAYTTPEGVDQILHASVDNLGSGAYSLNIAYLQGTNRVYRKIPSSGTGWEFTPDVATRADSYGWGLWRVNRAETTERIVFEDTIEVTPEATIRHIISANITDGTQIYLWNGEEKTVVIEGRNDSDRYEYAFTAGGECFTETQNSTTTTEWLTVPSADYKQESVDYQLGFISDTCGGSSTAGNVQFQYFTQLKTSQSGDVAIAVLEESINTPEITPYGIWYSGTTATRTPEPLTFQYFDYYLDIQSASSFSATPIADVQYNDATSGADKEVTVKFYGSGFSETKTEKVKVYKPSVSGGTFTWHGASYHT